jgi:hypothetical protein
MPSPSKRRRLSHELDAARVSSTEWLCSVWSSLADKYGDVSDDDVVDLDTMTVCEVAGHLDRMPAQQIGSFEFQRPAFEAEESASESEDALEVSAGEDSDSGNHFARLREVASSLQAVPAAQNTPTKRGNRVLARPRVADADESDDEIAALPLLQRYTPRASSQIYSASPVPQGRDSAADSLDWVAQALKPSSACSRSTATSSASRLPHSPGTSSPIKRRSTSHRLLLSDSSASDTDASAEGSTFGPPVTPRKPARTTCRFSPAKAGPSRADGISSDEEVASTPSCSSRRQMSSSPRKRKRRKSPTGSVVEDSEPERVWAERTASFWDSETAFEACRAGAGEEKHLHEIAGQDGTGPVFGPDQEGLGTPGRPRQPSLLNFSLSPLKLRSPTKSHTTLEMESASSGSDEPGGGGPASLRMMALTFCYSWLRSGVHRVPNTGHVRQRAAWHFGRRVLQSYEAAGGLSEAAQGGYAAADGQGGRVGRSARLLVDLETCMALEPVMWLLVLRAACPW